MIALTAPHSHADSPDRTSTRQIHVYAHTHWDREWYQPFERFRMQLVAAVDMILDTLQGRDDFRAFVLDGQTIVVDDYLAVRPERAEALRALVAAGRLEVGPWYILPDEFLVSGESFIRNLLEGRRRSLELGRRTDVGYLPDPFGHIAQLPQILRGFGIDNVIFSRGMGDAFDQLGSEFAWVAPDGRSMVLALVQTATYTNGYCNAEVLSKAHVGGSVPLQVGVEDLAPELASMLAQHARSGVLLFAAGCDHETINPDLPDLVRRIDAQLPDTSAAIGGLSEYVDAVRVSLEAHGGVAHLPRYTGELRGALHAPILAAIFSARIPLKQDNARVQTRLERVVEPLVSLAHALGVRRADVGMLEHAWRIALQNQPHDSIGGCSVDSTHEDMPARTRAALQVADGLVEDIAIATGLVDTAAVFNPHPYPISGVVSSDSHGYRHVHQVPGMSLTRWSDLPEAPTHEACIVDAHTIRSDRFEVGVSDDGKIYVCDLHTGERRHHALQYVDVGDVGDEYDFSPGRGACVAELNSVDASSDGPGHARLTLRHTLELPSSATDHTLLTMPITTMIDLVDGQPWVACTAIFTNTASDHRLRVRTCVPGRVETSWADGHFGWISRPARPEPAHQSWAQDPVASTYCEAGVAGATALDTGTALLGRGLHEYEITHRSDDASWLELTILRAVGWLSRDTIVGRPGHAGPALPTPGAQCIGTHTVEFAIIPFTTGELRTVPRRAREFAAPLHVIEPVDPELRQHSGQEARERDIAAARPVADAALAGIASRMQQGLVHIEGDAEFSALKPASDRSGDLVLRLYALGDTDASVRITTTFPVASAAPVHLDESPNMDGVCDLHPLESGACELLMTIPAGTIHSIRITPGTQA
jgi:mannosylglycerate hydrolase